MGRMDADAGKPPFHKDSLDPRDTTLIIPSLATLLSIFHTVLYVGVLYLSPQTRPRRPASYSDYNRQNDPEYIKLRIRAVTVATGISLFVTAAVIRYWNEAARWGGIWGWETVKEAVKLVTLVGVLFLGTLWERGVVLGGWRWVVEGEWREMSWSWVVVRTLVAGPVTEELVFRACMVPLHILARRSFASIVFTTPLFFGIAHIHHLYEFLLRNPGRLGFGILRTAFQFTYTTLFGWFATFVFIRTGSAWNAILVHSMCNWLGVPTFGRVSEDADGWGTWVDYVHWGLHGVGIVGFAWLLWPLTDGVAPLMR
ncbi:hypothetical protein BDZ91DRAFT_720141 [Kalaharituber pfeilii]|nr:hypothetical protein BDZ91DRAFT_720141 [Kalaharituber pfeilii]